MLKEVESDDAMDGALVDEQIANSIPIVVTNEAKAPENPVQRVASLPN